MNGKHYVHLHPHHQCRGKQYSTRMFLLWNNPTCWWRSAMYVVRWTYSDRGLCTTWEFWQSSWYHPINSTELIVCFERKERKRSTNLSSILPKFATWMVLGLRIFFPPKFATWMDAGFSYLFLTWLYIENDLPHGCGWTINDLWGLRHGHDQKTLLWAPIPFFLL